MPKSRGIVGCVEDQNGEPLVGAVVLLSGTSVGTETDRQGNYSLPFWYVLLKDALSHPNH